MTENELHELLLKLRLCRNVLIIGHAHPDGDCVGSAAALAGLLEAMGKTAKIAFPEPLPRRLTFILHGREAADVLPADLSGYEVICVDVASAKQLGVFADALCGKVLFRIDHHDIGTPYAASEFVDARAAATGEILFDLVESAVYAGYIDRMPEAVADALFSAISSDTGCFKYANVTPQTHRRAAILIERGTDAAKINRLLFDVKDPEQIKAEGIVQSRLRLFADGRISGAAVCLADYRDGLSPSDFETGIDVVRSVRGAEAAVIVKETPEGGTFRVSMRSNESVDVAAVAAQFGGGGHVRAAGCTVTATDACTALETVVREILAYMPTPARES